MTHSSVIDLFEYMLRKSDIIQSVGVKCSDIIVEDVLMSMTTNEDVLDDLFSYPVHRAVFDAASVNPVYEEYLAMHQSCRSANRNLSEHWFSEMLAATWNRCLKLAFMETLTERSRDKTCGQDPGENIFSIDNAEEPDFGTGGIGKDNVATQDSEAILFRPVVHGAERGRL